MNRTCVIPKINGKYGKAIVYHLWASLNLWQDFFLISEMYENDTLYSKM